MMREHKKQSDDSGSRYNFRCHQYKLFLKIVSNIFNNADNRGFALDPHSFHCNDIRKKRKSQEYICAVKMNHYYIPNNFQVMNGLISILKVDIQNSHGFLPVR